MKTGLASWAVRCRAGMPYHRDEVYVQADPNGAAPDDPAMPYVALGFTVGEDDEARRMPREARELARVLEAAADVAEDDAGLSGLLGPRPA